MSRENLELARLYFEAFNAHGLDGTEHLRHPDIEVFDPPSFPDVIFRMRGRTAHGGGLPLETAFAHVLAFEAGTVRRIRQYLSRAEALEAAGLSE
jgi:ketosteroid isomerase-like protein